MQTKSITTISLALLKEHFHQYQIHRLEEQLPHLTFKKYLASRKNGGELCNALDELDYSAETNVEFNIHYSGNLFGGVYHASPYYSDFEETNKG